VQQSLGFLAVVDDHLKHKVIAESLVGGMLGYQAGGITFGRYGKGFRPDVLAPVIELVTLESFQSTIGRMLLKCTCVFCQVPLLSSASFQSADPGLQLRLNIPSNRMALNLAYSVNGQAWAVRNDSQRVLKMGRCDGGCVNGRT
jgi:hypothetical protein